MAHATPGCQPIERCWLVDIQRQDPWRIHQLSRTRVIVELLNEPRATHARDDGTRETVTSESTETWDGIGGFGRFLLGTTGNKVLQNIMNDYVVGRSWLRWRHAFSWPNWQINIALKCQNGTIESGNLTSVAKARRLKYFDRFWLLLPSVFLHRQSYPQPKRIHGLYPFLCTIQEP